MRRRGRGPRGPLALSWALLVAAVLLCVPVSLPSPALGAGPSAAAVAVDHQHSTLSGDSHPLLSVSAHDERRIARSGAHTPGPAGAVDLDLAAAGARPGAGSGHALAPSSGPGTTRPASTQRGRAPPA